jgi:osmoprotectant transport system substrate-binding protein
VRPGPAGIAAVLLLVVAACGSEAPAPAPAITADTVRFASYDFPENQILVEVYAEAARRAGVPVSVQHGIGTREVVSPALQQGVVDVVVDYLGTALSFARPDFPDPPVAPTEMWAVLARVMGGRGVLVLDAAEAEDQNGFAVTARFAADRGVDRISDLEPLAGDLSFGGPPECPDRPFCLTGLRDVYGLRFGEVRSMPSRAATVDALLSGQIDVGLLETTDARLAGSDVVLLEDDRSLQPHENVVPMIRTVVAGRWGDGLTDALNAVSLRLTTADLVRLNRSVEFDELTPAEAAARWWGD